MADNPQDRPYAQTPSTGTGQRGSGRYSKAYPIVSQDKMRHSVLPKAAADAAAQLAKERASGTTTKNQAYQRYHQLLKEYFKKYKTQEQNVS